jgi:SAM-dependent methyltransferase
MGTGGDSRQDDYPLLIDPAGGAVIARLIDREHLVTRAVGGLFPEGFDIDEAGRILDLACGPGAWVQEVAFHHPEIEVVGIDLSRPVLDYARAMARVQRLDNAWFQEMDVLQPFDLPAGSFDLVNARFLATELPPTAWAGLLAECRRVLRPGGMLHLMEAELPITNSPATERACALVAAALHHFSGANFPGRHLGTTLRLGQLLGEANYQGIEQRAYALEWSAGVDEHQAVSSNVQTALYLLKPYLCRCVAIEPGEFERLYQQLCIE